MLLRGVCKPEEGERGDLAGPGELGGVDLVEGIRGNVDVAVTLPDEEGSGHTGAQERLVVTAAANGRTAEGDAEVFGAGTRDIGQRRRVVGDGQPIAAARADHIEVDVSKRLGEWEERVFGVIGRTDKPGLLSGP